MDQTEIPILYRCARCGQIEFEADWRRFAYGLECVHCSVRKHNKRWPDDEILQLLEFCRTYNRHSPQHVRIVSILLSLAFELMLEQLVYVDIDSLGYWGDKQNIVIEPLLEAYQGRTRLLTLARKIGYSDLPGKVANRRQKVFFQRWTSLARLRNKAVHGKLLRTEKLPRITLQRQINDSLYVFSRYNNLYNQESLAWIIHKFANETL